MGYLLIFNRLKNVIPAFKRPPVLQFCPILGLLILFCTSSRTSVFLHILDRNFHCVFSSENAS